MDLRPPGGIVIRPGPVLAVARRDLALVLRGRRGLGLVGVTALLLLPTATVAFSRDDMERAVDRGAWGVAGDVPSEVLALEEVFPADPERADLVFERTAGAPLVVKATRIPRPVRAVLDDGRPAVRVETRAREIPIPRRSLLFGLLSASVLTGALSESIPGERSRRTLEPLLASAVSRLELVLGKWAAWSGYGMAAALLAAVAALLFGRLPLGLWLLPLATVPACTVAVGLFLVRRTRDVVGGATVSMRVIPALVGLGGLAAWLLGQLHPLLGASLPLGGALLASGIAWEGIAPPLLATASTGATTAILLGLTARGLEQTPPRADTGLDGLRAAAVTVLVLGPATWIALAGHLLWGPAGNPLLAEGISRSSGRWAAAGVLLLWAAVAAGRAACPLAALCWRRPGGAAWGAALVAGVAAYGIGALWGHLPRAETGLAGLAAVRFSEAFSPAETGPLLALALAAGQELVFRGWLQPRTGWAIATVAFALVCAPLDPMPALALGALLGGLTHGSRSVLPALAARGVWILLAPAMG